MIDGDFSLDEVEGDEELFAGTWVFWGGLEVRGALTNAEMDSGPGLYVRGHLAAQRWWLTACTVRIAGALRIERLLICEYNHGELIVEGQTTAPLAVVLDHATEFRGGFDGRYEERSPTPPEALWESASAGPLILSPVVADTSAAPSRGPDATFAAAQSLLDHWSQAEKVVLFDGVDRDAFANDLALVLESLGDRFDRGAALGQWLMERDEVDDVLVDDAALLKLDDS